MSCSCDHLLPSDSSREEHYDNCVLNRHNGHNKHPVNEDGTLLLQNPHLSKLDCDVLYHLGLDTENHDFEALFGDVKFVCMGGTKHRMREFAEHMRGVLCLDEGPLVDLAKNSHRYAMYKVGPVLSVSHGVGIPSMTVLLQEIIKLLSYAKCKNPIIIRIGTCGGLKIAPGSVVISSFGLNGTLEKSYNLPILGKVRKFPAMFDKRLSEEMQSLSEESDSFKTYIGGTMAADDFYRGQGRTDGPFCNHTEADKLAFLNELYYQGVRNIEMECTALAAFTREAGVRSADVCVTLVDRLQGDQVSTPKSTLLEWQKRPMVLVGRFIAKHCQYITTL